MKHSITAVVLLASFACAANPSPQRVATIGKELPLTVRPVLPPAILKGLQLVSASEYHPKGQDRARVFRYNMRGTREGIRDAILKDSSLGKWTVDPKLYRFVSLGRDLKKGRVKSQALLLNVAKLVADPNAPPPTHTRVLGPKQAPGWVWMSYDEYYRDKP